jgi:hypothetical protein
VPDHFKFGMPGKFPCGLKSSAEFLIWVNIGIEKQACDLMALLAQDL